MNKCQQETINFLIDEIIPELLKVHQGGYPLHLLSDPEWRQAERLWRAADFDPREIKVCLYKIVTDARRSLDVLNSHNYRDRRDELSKLGFLSDHLPEELVTTHVCFRDIAVEMTQRPGVSIGLGANSDGGPGIIKFFEVARVSGCGKITLTGERGPKLRDSATIAWTPLRARAEILGIGNSTEFDVHLHSPEGDGPSAGVAIFCAFLSAFKGRSIGPDIALSGELSLSGRIKAVGGIPEKVIAAAVSGCRRVIIPKGNERDLDHLPEQIRSSMDIRPIKTIDEVLGILTEGGSP